MPKVRVGNQFDRLTAKGPVGTQGKNVIWNFQCTCGKVEKFLDEQVLSGDRKACSVCDPPSKKRQAKKKKQPKTGPRVRGKFKVFGEELTLTEAVKRFATVSRQAVYERLREGMNLEEALTKPPDPGFRKGNPIRPISPGPKKKPPSNVRIDKEVIAAVLGSVKLEYSGDTFICHLKDSAGKDLKYPITEKAVTALFNEFNIPDGLNRLKNGDHESVGKQFVSKKIEFARDLLLFPVDDQNTIVLVQRA